MSIINATTGGIVYTSDATNTLQLQTNGITALLIDANQNLSANINLATTAINVNPSSTITSGYGNIYANNYAANNTAYIVADNSFIHMGAYTSTQLNFKMAAQTAAFIVPNGSFIHTGATTLNTSGYGNLFVTNYAGNNTAYIVADNNFTHVGSVTNTQLNFKVFGQAPAYITTNGSFVHTGLTTLNTSGYGNVFVTNYAGNNTAYVVADNVFTHVGSATNTQLNLKVFGQTPAYINTNGSVVVNGATSLNTAGYGNLFVTNYAGNNTAYVIADNVFTHVGSATNTQLNLKVFGQTPAYINTNGSVVVNGLNSLNTLGYGNLFVTNYAGNNTAYVIADNLYTHIGSVTNTQVNFKMNATTPMFIGTSGNIVIATSTTSTSTTTGALVVAGGVGVSGNLYVSGNLSVGGNTTFVNTQTITTTDTIAAPTINAGTIGNSGATFTGATLTLTGNAAVNAVNAGQIGNGTTILVGTIGTASASQGNITALGTLTGLTVSGTIAPNANGTVNLGSASNYWGTVYASSFNGTTFTGLATSAKYADLAEMYNSDNYYTPGTVVIFGGDSEITISTISHDTRIAGIISTNPAYLMNDNFETPNWLPVALTGRVPCKVRGPVAKGDLIVSSDEPGIAQRLDKSLFEPGCIIGKSMETIADNSTLKIEISVGRF